MSSTTRTLKRLGVGTVGVCTLLSSPYLVTAANAVTSRTVTIVSQQNGGASTKNDGTNNTIKISADVSPAAATTDPAVAGVRFSYTPTGSTTPVVINTDTTYPYSVEFAGPAGGGTITELAEALDASGNVIGSDTQTPVAVSSTASSVHITSPTDGGQIGVFNGNIAVSGTRSADLPAITVTTQSRNNATGDVTTATTGNSATYDPGTPAAGASQAWSAVVPVPACANTSTTTPGCDVIILATTTSGGAAGNSDEAVEATLYNQTLTTVTVDPPSATKPAGASQVYTVTAKDQNGAAVAGLTVNASTASGPGTITPSAKTTDAAGNATFTGTATTAGTTTYQFQTQIGTAYNAQADFTRTATLTTYTSTPTSATLTAKPAKPLYASNPGSAEYNGTFPQVEFCVVDQNGNGYPSTNTNRPIVTDNRTSTTGTTTTTTTYSTPTLVVNAEAGTNCYLVNYPAATGDYGTDVFNAYYENNGTPGQQSGDVAAPTLTLKYATLSIAGQATQAQKGTTTTVSFKVLGADGSPFANRQVTLTSTSSTGSGGFTAAQPSGTTAPTTASPNTVIATTDANGIATATVNSPATTTTGTDTVTVTAADNITNATQKATGATSSPNSVVSFRDKSVAVTTITESGQKLIAPDGSPNNTGTPRPGDVEQVTYTLTDANSQPLANTSVALTLDHGFFTPNCPTTPNLEQYANCTFTPAEADGAQAGNLKNLGTTETVTTNASGVVTFSESIARDAALDVNGTVTSTVTAVANGGTAKDAVIDFSTVNIEPINGSAVKLVAVAPDTLSGDKQATTNNRNSNTTTPNTVTFAVHVLDQFGNLVQLPGTDSVALSVSGGTLNGDTDKTETAQGSYTGNEDEFTVESNTTSFTGTPATVTATWNAPVTTFKATTTGTAPNTTTVYTTVAGTKVAKTDSFTVNFYAVDTANLQYTFASTPSNSVPVNTAVTTSVTVKDQKGNAVQNLNVQFIRSGPDNQSNSNDFNRYQQTNTAGRAGYQFSSTTPGTATITVIVTDNSGNELSRGVQNVQFTPATSPSPTPTGTPAGPVTINGSTNQFVNFQQRVIIAGKAPANSTVTVYFHRVNVAGLTFKTFPADANGNWGTKYDATDDYYYYAVVGSSRSASVNSRMNPSLSTRSQTVHKGDTVTLSGRGGNRTRVYVHLGSAIASIRTAPGGTWVYQFTATKTVTVYATRPDNPAGTRSKAIFITVA